MYSKVSLGAVLCSEIDAFHMYRNPFVGRSEIAGELVN